jgi:hypothetical protein
MMRARSELDGQIAYDFDEFCSDYGHPAGQMFTFEVTHNAVTYVYADVVGTVQDGEVIFSLNEDDLILTRRAH